MSRKLVGTALAAVLCFSSTFAFGEPRGKGAEKQAEPRGKGGESKAGEKGGEKPPGENKSGNKPPGGAWSESKSSTEKQSQAKQTEELEGKNKNKTSQSSGAEGAAAEHAAAKNKSPQATGAEGAAAGAAASNRNKSQATGAEGAAAGAAVSNRNKPQASGAEGAAAGAAAANRNKPTASGAEGAAVGAAAVNRHKPPVSGAEGAAAGAAVANQRHPLTSGEAGAAGGYATVRSSFDHPNLYNEQWHADHPGAWTANNWAAGAAWNAANLAGVATHLGYTNNVPVSYNYGQNVTCQNGNVFLNGEDVGTAEHFSQQAANLAQAGQEAETADADEWLSLGVFALVRNEDQHPQLSLQLAVNKNGIIRGNYTDLVTDHTLPINGSVEQETQRAAWTVGNNKNFFMEAGISNLTSGEAPALIHKYGRTEKWLLISLPEPGSEEPVAAK